MKYRTHCEAASHTLSSLLSFLCSVLAASWPSKVHCCLQSPLLAATSPPLLEDDRQVEATWILALSLKALLVLMRVNSNGLHNSMTSHHLQGPASAEVVKMFLKEGLMMEISKLASKATRLSWKWLAPDLEVRTCLCVCLKLQ